jgi:branched-chain amino acid transport system ATP-binding protein
VTAILRVHGLTKRFGALLVVDDLSLSVAPGEALGIVGPNGAGKTTALNLVAGGLVPTSGSVEFEGADVTRLAAHTRCRRGMGRTAQVPRPFGGLTTFENVLVGAHYGGRHRRRAAAHASAAALERVGMGHLANVRAGSLGLLQRKRMELARALATEPRLLLLDEIAGGLTEAEVLELVATINAIRAEGVAIVWIEHIVHALLRVVDRILAIDAGRMLIEGDPHEVMRSAEVRAVYLGVEEVAEVAP